MFTCFQEWEVPTCSPKAARFCLYTSPSNSGVENVCCPSSGWIGFYVIMEQYLEMNGVSCLCPGPGYLHYLECLLHQEHTLGVLLTPGLSCEHLVGAHGKGLVHEYELLIHLELPVIRHWHNKPHSALGIHQILVPFSLSALMMTTSCSRSLPKTGLTSRPLSFMFKQWPTLKRFLHFHFLLGPIDYIASPGQRWNSSSVLSLLRGACHFLEFSSFVAL